MVSRNRRIAGIIQDSSDDIPVEAYDKLIQRTIDPEVLTFAVDVRGAGHEPDWLWTWDAGTLPYARENITLSAEGEIPLYKAGTYKLYNYSAFNQNGNADQNHKIRLKWINEPGDANLVDWVSYDSDETIAFTGVTNTAQKTETLEWVVPETFTIPTLNTSTTNYNIGAITGAYVHSGIAMGQNIDIGPLRRGNTYNFILDSTTDGHPFYLTTDSQGAFSAGTYGGEYTTGVTNSRAQGSPGTDATLTFVVPDSAPDTLYYQCGNHQVMGGEISIKDLTVEYNNDNELLLYFQHTQEGHFTPANIKELPSIASQMCLTWDATKQKFVPQDLRDYMKKTPSFVRQVKTELGLDEVDGKAIDSARTISLIDSNYISARVSGVDSASVSAIVDSNYVSARVGSTEQHTTLTQNGTLYVLNGSARWYAPRAVTIQSMAAYVQTAPVGSSLELRVNKNGSSIQTPTITTGNTSGSLTGLSDTMNAGDYLTVDITAVGSSTAGANLSLVIVYK